VSQKSQKPTSAEDGIMDFFQWTQGFSKEGAKAFGACYAATFELMKYVNGIENQFDNPALLATTLLSNVVGNILNFSYLMKQITVAQSAGDMLKIYFYMGRFAYLVLYFQPLAAVPS